MMNLPQGWQLVKLGDITKDKLIGLVRGSKEQASSKKYKYIKMNCILTNGNLNFDLHTNVDASDNEVERYSLKKGDFLFNTRNSYELVGKTAIFNSDETEWL
jgi:type I restriction enzyme, S subunit